MGSDAREVKSKESLFFYDVDCVGKGEVGEGEEAQALLSTARGQAEEEETVRWKKVATRKVQWSDDKGNRLVEVQEFEPSEASDSDEEDLFDSCICIVM